VICSNVWCTSGTLHAPITRSPVNFSSSTRGRDRHDSTRHRILLRYKQFMGTALFVSCMEICHQQIFLGWKKESHREYLAAENFEIINWKTFRYHVPVSRMTWDKKCVFAFYFWANISHPRISHVNISI